MSDQAPRTYRVGLTGGIGSGKSTVGRMLAERGAVLIDADQVARDVVEPGTPALAALAEEFGAGILKPDGSLDRAALAAIAFGDDHARARLNAITHPRIAERTAELFAQVPPGSVLVYEMPLLVELGLTEGYDLVVVVDAPDDVRVARLVGRGLSREDAEARMAAQATRDERNSAADVVVDNAGSEADLRSAVDALWHRVSVAARDAHSARG